MKIFIILINYLLIFVWNNYVKYYNEDNKFLHQY